MTYPTEPGPPGEPSIEELTIEPPGPGRSPGEISAILRYSMGLADAPPRQRDPAAPDTTELRRELGLE